MIWISVKKRLPKTAGMKIVFVPTADKSKPFIGMAWYEPKGTGNMFGWQLLVKAFCMGITHWMELPKPPKR